MTAYKRSLFLPPRAIAALANVAREPMMRSSSIAGLRMGRLGLVVPLAMALGATLASGQLTSWDPYAKNYFEIQVPNACTAEDPLDIGTFNRIYKASTGTCPGYTVYQFAKGSGLYPWSSETFVIDTASGFIEQLNEVSYNNANGAITGYRAFRDLGTGEKGLQWLPDDPMPRKAPLLVTWYPWFVEEYWTNNQGYPVCYNTIHTPVQGSVTESSARLLTTWTGWLQDKRAVSLNQSTWHNVRVLKRSDYWAGNNREDYYYGQWLDPATGTWKGIGLIKWEWWQISPSKLKGSHSNHYLVDCSVTVPCSTCPP